jgi:hypothetical protein
MTASRARFIIAQELVHYEVCGMDAQGRGSAYPTEAIFNIQTGVVAAYNEAPDCREHIAAFLFPDDLFGPVPQKDRLASSGHSAAHPRRHGLPAAPQEISAAGCRCFVRLPFASPVKIMVFFNRSGYKKTMSFQPNPRSTTWQTVNREATAKRRS